MCCLLLHQREADKESPARGEMAERDSPAVAASCGLPWKADATRWIEQSCCWICGGMSHWSDECPDNCCWSCGDRDHWSYRCPRSRTCYMLDLTRAKLYNNFVEMMIDHKYKELQGSDLMRAYLVDIASVEQKIHDFSGKSRSILEERLRLLRRKAEELAAVTGCSTFAEAAELEAASC